jgi:hypothetical protein
MAHLQARSAPTRFKTIVQANVPQGRSGKHNGIVTMILKDLDHLRAGSALKVPRATRKGGRKVATASDSTFLYVWNVTD